MSPYAILGVPDGAPKDEVKSAYRKLVKQYHPDLNPGDENAAQRFREVQEAYEKINSPTPPPRPRFNFTTVLRTAVEVSVEEAFHGSKANLVIRSPSGETVELMVDIPPMTISGTTLKVNGLPEQLETVDLYIIVMVSDRGNYRLSGTTVITHLNVDFVTAILGGEVSVQTLDGLRYFHVPAGSQPGNMVRLQGLGFQRPGAGAEVRDDFIVVLEISLPTSLSEEQKKALEHFRSLS